MNNPTGQLETLVTRAIDLVAWSLEEPALRGRGIRFMGYDDYKRGCAAYEWMTKTLLGQGHDALEKLTSEPDSEDNQAELRKQLTTLLQTVPSAAAQLAEIISSSQFAKIIPSLSKTKKAMFSHFFRPTLPGAVQKP